MDKGNLILSCNVKKCRKFKRDTYIFMGIPLVFIIFWEIFNYVYFDIILIPAEDINVNLLFIFSVGCVTTILIFLGLRINIFGIYEKGISPPYKPLSKMFIKDYFIPIYEISSIDTSQAPLTYVIKMKNGESKNIDMGHVFYFEFIDRTEHSKILPAMKKLNDLLQNK